MNYDIGVIGGGVIGLACAWRLAQGGASVVLVEKGEIAAEASWAAAGMLAAQSEAAHHPPEAHGQSEARLAADVAMLDLCLQSRALYSSFATELMEVSSIDIELSLGQPVAGDYRLPGILHVVHNDDPGIEMLVDQADCTELSRDEMARKLGESANLCGDRFFWMQNEGQVESRRLGKALTVAAQHSGVEIHSGTAAISLVLENGRAAGINTSRGRFSCRKVLLAAGAWSNQIENLPAACKPPVFPVAGEVLALHPPHVPRFIIYSAGVYLVPRRDGRLLIGATMKQTGFEKQTTTAGAEHLLTAAREIYPALNDVQPDDHWCGLRPATPDGLPIMGATPLENLYVSTGHYRNGILLTPVAAKLMADCILQDRAIDPAFAPTRFAEVS